jgi:hypothetical protein
VVTYFFTNRISTAGDILEHLITYIYTNRILTAGGDILQHLITYIYTNSEDFNSR